MLSAVSFFALLWGCQPDRQPVVLQDGAHDEPPRDAVETFAPPDATLHRLTQNQLRNSVFDVFGVEDVGALPVDLKLYGYTSVGSAAVTISPLDLELYEAMAWSVAEQVAPLGDLAARDALLGCSIRGAFREDDLRCARTAIAALGRRAWRRPLSVAELDEMSVLYGRVEAGMGEDLAVQAIVAGLLQSPHFLFRVERGATDPDTPRQLQYTSVEMASRLSFFLTDAPPDDALLEAGERGELLDERVLIEHAERLMDTPRARATLSGFFSETLDLERLALVEKDPRQFPEMTDDLRASMAAEVREIFARLALDEDAPLDALLTTDYAYVDENLAAIYGVEALGWVQLPGDQERGGVLGRAAFLAINSHATLNAPTLRGKFVRSRMLCQPIPPPPEGVVTSLDETNTEGTLRDRLARHATDPNCASCHNLMDPLGFGFEHFDPIGRWRALDNGFPVDASGTLDGQAYVGAAELADLLVADPAFDGCMALQLYRYGVGLQERDAQQSDIEAITAEYVSEGAGMRALAIALIRSPSFRTAMAPSGETCEADQEGERRACETDCGEGKAVCRDGEWTGCSAPRPVPEACNGVDDDCDGVVDLAERSCEVGGGLGLSICEDGGWSECEAPPRPPEQCNGEDDDGDGLIDEGLEVTVLRVDDEDLVAAMPGCDPTVDSNSGPCNAAIHRICGADACFASGFGAVDRLGWSSDLVCLDDDEAVLVTTTYPDLSVYHEGCTVAARHGPDCNAAVNRYCADRGWKTGYGPVEDGGDTAVIVCTPRAAVFETTYSVLSDIVGTCDGSRERMGEYCNAAFHQYCQDMGYEGGFGPLENWQDSAFAACVGALR
ncbi:MAG: DUF1592 domain-containing protein [Myxococcota bacterium]